MRRRSMKKERMKSGGVEAWSNGNGVGKYLVAFFMEEMKRMALC